MLNTLHARPDPSPVHLRKRRLDYSAPFWHLCVILGSCTLVSLMNTTLDQFPEHQCALPATQTPGQQV